VRLEPGFGQRLFEQAIVAPVQGYRVIPDLRRQVDGAVQVPEPLRPEKLELKGLTHKAKNSVLTNTIATQKIKSKSHIRHPLDPTAKAVGFRGSFR
jgi:hypothetical protein